MEISTLKKYLSVMMDQKLYNYLKISPSIKLFTVGLFYFVEIYSQLK